MARVMDGDVLSEDETVWTVVDAISGDEQEYESEPTKADVIAFKRDYGYSTVKVKKNTAERTITIRPVDKAGFYDYIC